MIIRVRRRAAMHTGPMLLLCCVLFVPAPASAAASPADLEIMANVASQLSKTDQLLASMDSVREWDRDGLSTRIDQLGVDAIKQLNAIAPRMLAAGAANETERAQLVKLLDRSAATAMRRDAALEERAAVERQLIGKFEQSAAADIARAFIEDLNQMRASYLAALVEQTEVRQAAGLDSGPLVPQSRERVSLIVERLTGQIRLDAMSLDELRLRLAEEPLDEDLKKAIEMVEIKQERSLSKLQRAIEIAERVGLDTAEQRGMIIRERGQLGVEILQRDVFSTLWNEQFTRLREDMARYGPNALFRLLLFSLAVLGAWLAARLIRYPVKALVHSQRFKLSYLLRGTLVSLSSTAVFVVGLVVALATIGVSLGPVFAGLGVLGILVGLAVQDSLGNLAAGAMILIYRPYDVDDHICVGGADGIVKRMNLLATTVATFDNQRLVVPNRRIWGDTIINYTASRVRRVDIEVSFAYGEDPDRVRAVLMDVIKGYDTVLETPEPQVHMTGMGESALTMQVKPWVRTQDYWATRWDLHRLIKKRFDDEGIEIPFPQRVVTLRPEKNGAPFESSTSSDVVPSDGGT